MDRALLGRVVIIQESKDPASSLPAYKSRIVGAVSGGSAGAQMRRFLKWWPGMVSIQVKLNMVGVCGSSAMVPGPRVDPWVCAGDHSVVVRGVRT